MKGEGRGSHRAHCWEALEHAGSSESIPRWNSCTCARRPRHGDGALERGGLAVLVGQVEHVVREDATSVQNVTRAVAPGASFDAASKALKIGSSTAPDVLESGWPSMTEIGVGCRARGPEKRAASVSNCARPTTSLPPTTRCAAPDRRLVG